MTSFLDLPLELRYQVYFYIAIPRYTYFSTYHGLYLSCHQVRNEMNQECGSILQKHLDLIGDSLPVGTIKFDPSVYAKQHVQMSLDFLFTGAKLNTPDPGFLKVCELYFALIEVKLLLEDFSLGDTLRVISLIGGLVRRKVVNAGCITLEIPGMNARRTERCRDHGIAEAERDRSAGNVSEFWWHKDLDGKVKVMWETK